MDFNSMNNVSRRTFLSRSIQAATVASSVTMLPSRRSRAAASHERIKIGQIGVGHAHAEGKMQVYRDSPDFEVVGVVEPNGAMRDAAAASKTYRGLAWMTQEQLLNTPGLKAVAVETEVTDLLNIAEACVAAGKHVHLDKPAGSSLFQFQRILTSADEKNLTVQMGYMYRYNPGVLLLRHALQEGWLGDVFEIHAVMSKQVNASKRARWAEAPGGTMFELGCHLIDLVVGVMGEPDSVTAFNQHSGAFDDVLLDNMLAVCKYPKATASIRSTALEVEGFDRRHVAVCGTEGTLQIQPLDDPSVKLALSHPRGAYRAGYQAVTFDKFERYIADAADFAKVIRGEKESDFDSAHDLAVQNTVLKACEMPLN